MHAWFLMVDALARAGDRAYRILCVARRHGLRCLGAGLLAVSAATAQAQSATPGILAYYKFDLGTAENLAATGNAMTLRNAGYANGGLSLNGISENSPGGYVAYTDTYPGLDFGSFSLLVEFSASKTGIDMPLLVMGRSYRALTLRIDATNRLNVMLNYGSLGYTIAGTTVLPNTWYKLALAYDQPTGKLLAVVNGGDAQAFTLPAGFALELVSASVADGTRASESAIQFGDATSPATFAGTVKTLIAFGQSMAASALTQITATLPAVPTPVTVSLTNPGIKLVSAAPFTVAATSTSTAPILVRTLTPSACSVAGSTVTPVAAGMCTLAAGHAGVPGAASVSFPISTIQYQALTRTSTGRGAYLVAPNFDMRASLFASAQGVRIREIIGLATAAYGNRFDAIFLVNNTADSSAIDAIGYAGYNVGVVSNDAGLGGSPFDLSEGYGAKRRLRSLMHIPWRAGIIDGPSLHEFMHNWGNRGIITNTADPAHWGYTSANGQLGGFDRSTLTQTSATTWTAKGPLGSTGFGTNANGGNGIPYGNLELYLMGLIPASELEPILLARNASSTDTGYVTTFRADGIDTLTASDLVARAGERFPSSGFTQKRFDVLFILISNATPTAADLAEFDAQVEEFTRQGSDGRAGSYNFWEATGGRASIMPVDIAALPSSATAVSSNDRLFEWAEHVFPTLFPSTGKQRGSTGIYDYACYTSNICLGLDAARSVYFYDGKSIIPVGRAADFATYMQAAGF